MSQNESTCFSSTRVEDASLRAALWGVYVAAFGDAETACIQEQLCYTRESFEEALLDPAYVKFVVKDADGSAAGILLCTNDLEKARIAYVNPKRLLAQFPEYAGRIWYFTAVAVLPTRQGHGAAAAMFDAATIFMDQQDALVAFDYSTEKNPMLPQFIVRGMQSAQKRHSLKTKDSTFEPLGGQQYGVIKMS